MNNTTVLVYVLAGSDAGDGGLGEGLFTVRADGGGRGCGRLG